MTNIIAGFGGQLSFQWCGSGRERCESWENRIAVYSTAQSLQQEKTRYEEGYNLEDEQQYHTEASSRGENRAQSYTSEPSKTSTPGTSNVLSHFSFHSSSFRLEYRLIKHLKSNILLKNWTLKLEQGHWQALRFLNTWRKRRRTKEKGSKRTEANAVGGRETVEWEREQVQ